ncbi:MAG: hypothetical protein QM813_09370 [Verrucomicrobiota bacterium]
MKTEVQPPNLVSRRTDERRRFNMPDECPPNALLTVQQLDTDLWLVRRVTAEELKPRAIVVGCECNSGVKFGASLPICAKCGAAWKFKSEKPADHAPAVKVT